MGTDAGETYGLIGFDLFCICNNTRKRGKKKKKEIIKIIIITFYKVAGYGRGHPSCIQMKAKARIVRKNLSKMDAALAEKYDIVKTISLLILR